jgi:hypothetical protein
MTAYPTELGRRFAADLREMRRAITKLQSRTAGIDSGAPLAALPAVIDAAYSSGNPKAHINGSATLTGPYQHLTSYTPAAGDSVLVLPTPVTAPGVTAYVVLGKLSS